MEMGTVSKNTLHWQFCIGGGSPLHAGLVLVSTAAEAGQAFALEEGN